MSFGGQSGGGVRSNINITPLVDVVLVLLIIFMVATPIPINELGITVPPKDEAVDVAAEPPPDQVVVSLTKDGKLQINREVIPEASLAERMHGILEGRREREKIVFFDIDDEANYGLVISAMDACRGAGARVLGVMTH
jgi:biopolymer transport protein TolR